MLLPLVAYAFSLLVGLAGLATCAWVIVTGQALTLDGLLMMAISLTVGAASPRREQDGSSPVLFRSSP